MNKYFRVDKDNYAFIEYEFYLPKKRGSKVLCKNILKFIG